MLGSPEPIQPSLQRLITPERKLEALQHVNRGRAGLSFLWDWAKIFTISVVLFFGIKTFLVEAFKIPSGSMERTLLVGDFLLVNKVVYGAELPLVSKRLPGLRRPTRGDVIVFEWPKDRSKNFVKRLVGLPGTRWRCGTASSSETASRWPSPYVSHSDPEADPVWEEFRWQSNFS
jgi:signal peptidase I